MNKSPLPRLLIVDDDLDIREALSDILALEGYDVTCAVNGSDALRILRENGPFALIILDLMMPIMNGEKFLAELKLLPESVRTAPVLVMTASELSERIYSLGAKCYLSKPLDIATLIPEVSRCIQIC